MPDGQISKTDLERLQFNRELMRQAGLTGPQGALPGETMQPIRRFAQETFMNVRMIDPDLKDKTIDAWEDALKRYIMNRRPEFRDQLIQKLRTGLDSETAQVLVTGARGLVKQGEAKPRKMHGWKHVGTKDIPGWGSPAILRVRTSGASSMKEFPKWASAMMGGFTDEIEKIAGAKEKAAMPSFTEQDRPEGVKKVYRALEDPEKVKELKERYGARWEEVKARIAARQGKKGKQKQGPPYKEPI